MHRIDSSGAVASIPAAAAASGTVGAGGLHALQRIAPAHTTLIFSYS